MCGKAVNLEECKVDANGLPVHEDCYVTKLTQAKSPQPIRKDRAPRGEARSPDRNLGRIAAPVMMDHPCDNRSR